MSQDESNLKPHFEKENYKKLKRKKNKREKKIYDKRRKVEDKRPMATKCTV